MNDREYYAKSPVAKFAISRGDISADKFLSRTFNRRLRMADTFTKVLPTYEHVPKTCYQKSYSHKYHPAICTDDEGKPLAKKDREYFHRMDQIKTYNEEMMKLGVFAPLPRKAVKN